MNLRGIAGQSFWIVSARFAALGMSAVFTILLARMLGVEGFGQFAFIAAFLFVVNGLTTFGTDMHLIREIASKGDLSQLSNSLLAQILFSTLFILLVWCFGGWLPNQNAQSILALKIYCFTLYPLAVYTVCTSVLRGKKKMVAYALLNLAAPTLQVVWFLLYPADDLTRVVLPLLWIQVAVSVLAWTICTISIKDFNRALFYPQQGLVSLMKICAPIALLALLGMIFQRMSVGMLALIDGPDAAGIFSAASRMTEAVKLVPAAALTALYPALSEEMKNSFLLNPNAEKMQDLKMITIVLAVGSILASTLLVTIGQPIFLFFFGEDYAPSLSVLKILAWTILPFAINSFLTLVFLASNQDHVALRALTVSVIALFVLNLIWIPAWGPAGSAWAMFAAEFIQSIFLIGGLRLSLYRESNVYGYRKSS